MVTVTWAGVAVRGRQLAAGQAAAEQLGEGVVPALGGGALVTRAVGGRSRRRERIERCLECGVGQRVQVAADGGARAAEAGRPVQAAFAVGALLALGEGGVLGVGVDQPHDRVTELPESVPVELTRVLDHRGFRLGHDRWRADAGGHRAGQPVAGAHDDAGMVEAQRPGDECGPRCRIRVVEPGSQLHPPVDRVLGHGQLGPQPSSHRGRARVERHPATVRLQCVRQKRRIEPAAGRPPDQPRSSIPCRSASLPDPPPTTHPTTSRMTATSSNP
jgi:hypothetical protein